MSSSRSATARLAHPSGTWQMHGPPVCLTDSGYINAAACVPTQAAAFSSLDEDQSSAAGSTISFVWSAKRIGGRSAHSGTGSRDARATWPLHIPLSVITRNGGSGRGYGQVRLPLLF